ncbi:MAG TPA: TldD/PmbA family protein [Firmicutes bacterium]|nr:TldD/PmbA family protein [Bacillota bacterium]
MSKSCTKRAWGGHEIVRNLIEGALRSHGADYIDIRIEDAARTKISLRGRGTDELSVSRSMGGCVRALAGGGWGFASFNDIANLKDHVALAVSQAKLVSQANGDSLLVPVEPVNDTVVPTLVVDPRSISLAAKRELLEEYNQIMLGYSPKIQTTTVRYRDTYSKKLFANSEGAFIEQEHCDVGASCTAIAREGDNVQQMFIVAGGVDGYQSVQGQHDRVRDCARRAVLNLDAAPAKAGQYTVVLDPALAGTFVHEAFGHLSESDFIYDNETLRDIMVLGKQFGSPILGITDGAAAPGHRGSYRYDDEGVPASLTPLIREGVLVGRLHSRETAGRMGERPTGNARAINYRFRPIVRMTNTYIENGRTSFEEMISDIDEGIYAIQAYGGETTMEMFTFSAMEAFMIRKGEIAERVRNVVLTGNVFETLMNIDAVGNDLAMNDGGTGGCGKGQQAPLSVSDGSPHIRIRNVVVGGD